MSEWRIEVVRIGEVEHHPNADRLDTTHVHGGYPCIVRRGEFAPRDFAVYIPVDTLLPADDPRWDWLAKGRTPVSSDGRLYHRIRAVKLRGVFSMGLLVPCPGGHSVGDDLAETFGARKYEPPEPTVMGGENEKDPGFLPVYDVEALRRHPDVLREGEDVVITEKIHGANGRWAWHRNRLWVASHRCFKRAPEDSAEGTPPVIWWRVAVEYRLAKVLAEHPGLAIYGEVFGRVQDLRCGGGLQLAVFDMLDITSRRWLDFNEAQEMVAALGLPWVPVLYRGPWSPDLVSHAEGQSTRGVHVREGIVIRPTVERWDDGIGRVQLKMHGEGYLTRKKGKRP